MQPTTRKGFTLLELLIVIGIIGLLATFAAVSLGNSRMRARDTKRVSDLRQFRKALELGFNQGDGYPVENTQIILGDATHKAFCGKDTAIGFVPDSSLSNCDKDKIYLGFIPADPLSSQNTFYQGTANSYCLEAVLENGTDGLVAGTIIADNEALRNGTCP